MGTWRGRLTALLLVLAAGACASTVARPRAQSDLITREQIEQNRFTNAYEAVLALHPNWTNVKAKALESAQPGVAVYVDDVRMPQGVEELRAIESQRIQFIRHYDPVEATQRWGVGHTEGAIMVSTQPE